LRLLHDRHVLTSGGEEGREDDVGVGVVVGLCGAFSWLRRRQRRGRRRKGGVDEGWCLLSFLFHHHGRWSFSLW